MISLFGIGRKLDAISAKLDRILANQTTEVSKMAALDDAIAALQADVTQDTSAVNSAVTTLSTLSSQLAAALQQAANAGATPAELSAIQAVQTAWQANIQNLSAAIAQNTPAQPSS